MTSGWWPWFTCFPSASERESQFVQQPVKWSRFCPSRSALEPQFASVVCRHTYCRTCFEFSSAMSQINQLDPDLFYSTPYRKPQRRDRDWLDGFQWPDRVKRRSFKRRHSWRLLDERTNVFLVRCPWQVLTQLASWGSHPFLMSA